MNRRVRNRTHGGVGGRGSQEPLLPDEPSMHRSSEVKVLYPTGCRLGEERLGAAGPWPIII